MSNEDTLPKAICSGILQLGPHKISCAVLNDVKQTRVLVERSMANALGKRGGGAYWQDKKEGKERAELPEYASAKYLYPFMTDSLKESLVNQISYINKNNVITTGVNALVLPDICDLWIRARDNGALDEKQIVTANRAYILMKAFSKIGIMAMIDEVTGFIFIKEKDEYKEQFKAFIREEFEPAQWNKEFPDIFFDHLYRLYNKEIRVKSAKRPKFFAGFIRKYIYHPLANSKGMILKELEDKNPVIYASGGRKYKLFQFLTDEVGLPEFKSHLWQIIGIMKLCKDKNEFKRYFKKAFPEGEVQFDIDF